jgi:predicted ribosome quality control (RQC) complex YloA/Tae2 family protein
MAFDGIVLAAVTAEMQRLMNSRIYKIYQPERREIVLHCRLPGASLPVVLSADPQSARAYLAVQVPDNPPSPPAFCMLLRKYLEGGRILGIIQPDLERILVITIENMAETGELAHYRLISEIMGRHSNIILVDSSNTVLDAINRVDSRVNRYREIVPGATYIPPPDQAKLSPLTLTWQGFLDRLAPAAPKARLSRLILDNFAGLGPVTAKEVVHQAGFNPMTLREEIDEEGLRVLYEHLLNLGKRIHQGKFAPQMLLDIDMRPLDISAIPLDHLDKKAQSFDSMSLAVETHFAHKLQEQKLSSWHHNLSRVIEGHQRRLAKKRQAQATALQEAEAADTYRIFGELVTASLYKIEKGMDKITVPNFYDPNQGEITIPLDPRLSPSGNAQEYFRRYNRAKKTKVAGLYQYNRTVDEEKYLEQVQATLDMATSVTDMLEIQRELAEEGYIRTLQKEKHKRTSTPKPKPLRFQSQDGLEILVGRNNRQNDYVTFRLGRLEDMWLHVKDIPGSHVIIKGHGRNIPESTLIEAALIAAYYSKARTGQNVPVDYTFRKHVRKPKGAKPGMVIYDHHSTLFVSPQVEIIRPLVERQLDDLA